MSIKYYQIAITPMSKPRGQLGKFGNLTHSVGRYREFQKEIEYKLRLTNFSIPVGFFALAYVLFMGKKRGRANDVGNMIGALEDVFVKYEYIKDDSYKHLPRFWSEAVESRNHKHFSIVIFTMEVEKDLETFVLNRSKMIEKFQTSMVV